jgi:hypothetical protein
MNRRELYRRVSELLVEAGGARPLLDAVAGKMRLVRGLSPPQIPASSSARLGSTASQVVSFSNQLDSLAELFLQDDALGQIYQAINAPALQRAYRATTRERRKFSAEEIPAVTQLFTPKFVVEFLLQNTLGRHWLQMHPESRLAANWCWLNRIGSPGELSVVRDAGGMHCHRKIREIKICDPACGTMNFGLVALDMLREMYREEMDRAGQAGWPVEPSSAREGEIDFAILRNNLVGIDIDAMALDLARRAFEIKMGREIEPGVMNLHCADALVDLDGKSARSPAGEKNALAGSSFDIVVTNPPYLSARNLATATVGRLKKKFPNAWRDAYACFIKLACDLLKSGGRAGILSMHSFMFTAGFEKFRRELMDATAIETAAHFGPGLFDIGNPGTLQTVAMCVRKEAEADRRGQQVATFFRLVEEPGKCSALREAIADPSRREVDSTARESSGALAKKIAPARAGDLRIRFDLRQSDLRALPRGAWMYWLPAAARHAFAKFPKLGEIAPPKQGLATTDNRRFVRFWWEVERPAKFGIRFGTRTILKQSSDSRDARNSAEVGAALASLESLAPRESPESLATIAPCESLAPIAPCESFAPTAPCELLAPIELRASRWIPYAKGGRFRRWFESPRHRVFWEDEGREIKQSIVDRYPYLKGQWKWVAKNAAYYGRAGITYSYLTSGLFSARVLEGGTFFDVAGSSLFPADSLGILGILNSSAARYLLAALNPTVNFQVGDLSELPIPSAIPDELRADVAQAIELTRQIDSFDETSSSFCQPAPWGEVEDDALRIERRVAEIQRRIDARVAELYGIAIPSGPEKVIGEIDRVDLASRWISFALGISLGRWGGEISAGSPALRARGFVMLSPVDGSLVRDLREILTTRVGESSASEIGAAVGGIDRFLSREFAAWHNRLYQSRPVYWIFSEKDRTVLVPHEWADGENLSRAFGAIGATLPAGFDRWIDDGIAINLSPLWRWIGDRKLRVTLKGTFDDLVAGKFSFSRTSDWVLRNSRATQPVSAGSSIKSEQIL